MLVLVEGIDRVGKTTLAKRLEEQGYIYLKDEFLLPQGFAEDFKEYSLGKCETLAAHAIQLHKAGKNVVIDRLHLTEMVYGSVERCGMVNYKALWALDSILAREGAILLYVKPSDLNLSNEEHGKDQTEHLQQFDYMVTLSEMKRYSVTYEFIDDFVNYLIGKTTEYDFYFASPFFNPEQVEREERMINHLRYLGFKVFSPKENCHLDAKAGQESRQNVFNDNVHAINNSKAVFAVTDGKDIGTIWEAGYAFGINKPVIYFAETLGDNKFNLMLAQSGKDVYLSQEEVTFNSLHDSMNGKRRLYRGDIE